jgi:RHS repeat-associated protein
VALACLMVAGWASAGWGNQIDTTSWFLRTQVATALFSSVTRGGELFVAVGEGFIDNGDGTWSRSNHGAMWISGDGGSWIDLPSAASLPILRAAAFGTVKKGESLYAVLGDDKTLLTSPDGLTWTQGTLPTDIAPRALTYRCTATEAVTGACLAGQFVAVGWDGILTSVDALNWTEILPATPDQPSTLFQYLNAVIFDGSRFVAVGGMWASNTARILTSSDGISWSNVSPDPAVQAELYGVAYGDGVWLAVGGHSSGGWYAADILRSTDRATWTPVTQSIGDKVMAAVHTGSEFVLAAGTGQNSNVRTSPDGLTWTAVAIPYGAISGFNGAAFALGADTVVGVGLGVNGCGFIQSSNSLRSRRGGTRDNPFALFDSDGQAPRIGLPVYRVNTAALNLILEGSLFFMKTLGAPVNLRLTFNAYPGTPPGMFGNNWWFSYESGLTYTEATARLVTGSGKPLTFAAPAPLGAASAGNPVALKPPVGVYDQLTSYGDYWLFKEKKSRRTYRFTKGSADQVAYLSSITDKNGNMVSFTVDPATGRVSAIADPAGRTITFAYTGGYCTQITVPDGRTIAFTYDGSGNLTGMTDMNGHHAVYVYDGDGFMTRMTVEGRVVSFAYFPRPRSDNGDKCLGSVTDPVNGATAYEFLPNSTSKVKRTSAKGVVTNLAAQDGNTSVITDPLSHVRSVGYVDGLPSVFSNAGNRKTTFTYDERGNLTRLTQPAPLYTTSFTYGANDLMTRQTDSLYNNWDYAYDAAGNTTGVTTPLGYVSHMVYDSQGRLVSATDAAGHAATFANDNYGNTTAVTDPLGNATAFAFDAFGLRCTRVTDARGNVKTLEYDGNDRLTQINYLLPGGGKLSAANSYDAFGQTSAVDEKGNRTVYERNLLGFVTRVTDPLGAVSSFEYDANNNVVKSIDPLLHATTFAYDDADRATGDTDPLGNTITRTYDADGNLTSLANRRGKSTAYTYEYAGLLKTLRYPGAATITYTRDRLGRITGTTNGRGRSVYLVYDKDGRLTEKLYGDVSQATFAYDPAGNLTAVTDAGETIAYAYDAHNQVTRITYPGGKAVSFGYDATGNLSRLVYPDGTAVDYTYDSINRVRVPQALNPSGRGDIQPRAERGNQATSATWDGGSLLLAYDAAGNLIRESRNNGAVTEYAYDAAGRLTEVIHKGRTAEIARLSRTYDAAGNCRSESASGLPGRPLPASVASATYNDADQIAAWGGRNYTYDGDGNLTAIDNNELSATYDDENRLTSLSRGGVTVAYAYDGNGNRSSAVSVDKTIHYHYDRRGRLLFETDESGTVTANYIYAGNRLAARGVAAGGYRYYHYDGTGSTLAQTDAAGEAAVRYGYNPYGGKVVQGDDGGNPATFVGAYGVLDEGNGLYLMKKRFYDAATGRFLQRDPTGFAGGLNLFAYAGGNPANRIDPNGTEWTPANLPSANDSKFGDYSFGWKPEADKKPPRDIAADVNGMKEWVKDKIIDKVISTATDFITKTNVVSQMWEFISAGNEENVRLVRETEAEWLAKGQRQMAEEESLP